MKRMFVEEDVCHEYKEHPRVFIYLHQRSDMSSHEHVLPKHHLDAQNMYLYAP